MSKRIRGITIQIGAETTGLDKALKDVNARSRDINKELREVNKLLKFNPKDTELLSQKHKLLGEQIEATKEKLDKLRAAQDEVRRQYQAGEIDEGQYRAFQREIIETESKLKHYESQLKEVNREKNIFSQRIEDASKKLKDIGSKMQDVGKQLSMKVTAPIVAFGGLATKSAIDFESAFAGVRKTVDATDVELSELGKGIRDMAKEIPAAATEIAGVAEAAGQLGIETPNILAFTRTMIDLGEATNLTAEEAASSLAKFANITQMSQKDFDRLGSVIVALGNNLATTEADIVSMGQRLAGAGAQIGLTEAQIMAFAGALSSVGIEAEAGGSAFSKVMADMQLAVETNSERLQAFADVAGMSAEEFREAFQENAAGAIIAFIQGLGNAEERGVSAIKILDDMGISEVRLRDALLRAAGASDVFTEALNLGTQAWEDNTALTKEAEQRYETTESKIAIFKNTLNDLGITFGEHILPVITNFIEKIKSVIEWFGNLSPETQKTILVIAGLVAAIGPIIIIIGKIISGVSAVLSLIGTVSGAIAVVTTGATAATPAIAGLASVFTALTGPIGLVIAAIAAAIAIGVLLWKNWDKIKEFAGKLWEGIKDIFAKIGKWISDTWNKAKEWTSNTWNNIKNTVSETAGRVRDGISSAFGSARDSIVRAWERVKENTSNAWNTIRSKVEEHGGGIRGVISTALEGYKNSWRQGWEAMNRLSGGKLGEMVSSIKSKMSDIRDRITNSKIGQAWSKIWDLKLPNIKLPKFSITGKFSLSPLQVPKISVVWNAKGALLDGATLFGIAGNTLLGGGEAGKEAVIPLEGRHMYPLADAIVKRLSSAIGGGQIIIQNMNVRDDTDIYLISRELFNLHRQAQLVGGNR